MSTSPRANHSTTYPEDARECRSIPVLAYHDWAMLMDTGLRPPRGLRRDED